MFIYFWDRLSHQTDNLHQQSLVHCGSTFNRIRKFSVFLIHIFSNVFLMDILIFGCLETLYCWYSSSICLKTAAVVAEVENSLQPMKMIIQICQTTGDFRRRRKGRKWAKAYHIQQQGLGSWDPAAKAHMMAYDMRLKDFTTMYDEETIFQEGMRKYFLI